MSADPPPTDWGTLWRMFQVCVVALAMVVAFLFLSGCVYEPYGGYGYDRGGGYYHQQREHERHYNQGGYWGGQGYGY